MQGVNIKWRLRSVSLNFIGRTIHHTKRVQSMLGKRLIEIDLGYLQELVAAGISESRSLEFKSEHYDLDAPSPPRKEHQLDELLKDVSALANTDGGDLLIGIDAEGGIAKSIPGISLKEAEVDAVSQRIQAILTTGLEPSLRVDIGRVAIDDERRVLIIRVPKSSLAPHRLVRNQNTPRAHLWKFFGRNSSGAFSMDTSALREAFTLSATVYKRMRLFRAERLSDIQNGRIPNAPLSCVVCHILPFSSFSNANILSNEQLEKIQFSPPPLSSLSNGSPGFGSFNFHGRIFRTSPESKSGFIQIHRNGALELVATDAHVIDERTGEFRLKTWVLTHLVERLSTYLAMLKQLEIVPPAWCCLSIVSSVPLHIYHWYKGPVIQGQLHSELVECPERELRTFDDLNSTDILRPLLDIIWNSAGIERCPFFSRDGKYQPPER
jgi:hypothetical protein